MLTDKEYENTSNKAWETVLFCHKLGIRFKTTNKKDGDPEMDKRKWEDIEKAVRQTLPINQRGHFGEMVIQYFQELED